MTEPFYRKNLLKKKSPAQEARANGLHLHGFPQYQDHTGFWYKMSGFSPVSFSLVQNYTAEATDALDEWVQDLISQETSSNYVICLLLNHRHLCFAFCKPSADNSTICCSYVLTNILHHTLNRLGSKITWWHFSLLQSTKNHERHHRESLLWQKSQ